MTQVGEELPMNTCRICGKPGEGQDFDAWVPKTFTNWDLLFPGEVICDACAFWFAQRSEELARRTGKEKLQRMQNYSHFLKAGEWIPLGKGDKARMQELLLAPPFPEMAAITTSGQKHIAFRARRRLNPPGATAGWVQFEEHSLWVEPENLRDLLDIIEELYTIFSKDEIGSGTYSPNRIMRFGLDRWRALDERLRPVRPTVLFQLALFLAQRSEEDNDRRSDKRPGSHAAQVRLAGDPAGLQEPLPDDDLDAVRERNPGRGLHQQPGEISQLSLFQAWGDPGPDGG